MVESVLPLDTGRLSRLAINRLMADFSSSMYMLSISFTTNLGCFLIYNTPANQIIVQNFRNLISVNEQDEILTRVSIIKPQITCNEFLYHISNFVIQRIIFHILQRFIINSSTLYMC